MENTSNNSATGNLWNGKLTRRVTGLRYRLSHLVRPYDYFISYAREDGSGVAEQIAKRLTETGRRVFLDKRELHEGAELTNEISAALGRSSVLIPIITRAAGDSKYVIAEVELFRSLNRTVLPVYVPSIREYNHDNSRLYRLTSHYIQDEYDSDEANLGPLCERLINSLDRMRVLYRWIAYLLVIAALLLLLTIWALIQSNSAIKGWRSSAIQQMAAVSRTSELPFEEAATLAATSYSIEPGHPSAWQALAHHSIELNHLDGYVSVNDDGKLYRHYKIGSATLITTISHKTPGAGELVVLEHGIIKSRIMLESAPLAICHLPDTTASQKYIYLDFNGNLHALDERSLLSGDLPATLVFTGINELLCLDRKQVLFESDGYVGTWNGDESSEPEPRQLPPQTRLLGNVGSDTLVLAASGSSDIQVVNTQLELLHSVQWDTRFESFNTPNALRQFTITSSGTTAWIADNQGRLRQVDVETGEVTNPGCDLAGEIPYSLAHVGLPQQPMLVLGGTRGSIRYHDLSGFGGCVLVYQTQVSNTSIQHLLPNEDGSQLSAVDGNGKISLWHVPGSFASKSYRIPSGAFPTNITGDPESRLNIQFISPRSLSAIVRVSSSEPPVVDDYKSMKNNPVCLLYSGEEWCIDEGTLISETTSIPLGHASPGRYLFDLQRKGSVLAVLNQDSGDIAIIDLALREKVYQTQIMDATRTIAIADHRPEVAVGVTAFHISAVNYESGEHHEYRSVAPFGITALAYDHEGHLWISSTSKSSLKRLSSSTEPEIIETGIEGTILDFHFSTDGHWLVAGSMSGNTIIMNLETGYIERNPVNNSSNQAYLAHFPWDNNMAVFGSSGGVISIVNMDFASVANTACSKLSEHLSQDRLARLGLSQLDKWSAEAEYCQH